MLITLLLLASLFHNHIPKNEATSFSEAPQYLNDPHCPIVPKNDMSFSCTNTKNDNSIHIAMTIDSHYLRGSIASIHSILKHSSCPQNLFFHLITSQPQNSLKFTIKSTFPSLQFNLYFFDEKRVKHLISASLRRALDSPLNYARTYLADLIDPCVDRVIYLDSDTVVVDDIADLWSAFPLRGSAAIGAPEYCHVSLRSYFTAEFWSDADLVRRAFQKDRRLCYFNTGVMAIDLGKWRERDLTREIEDWMRIQKEKRIYELGSLPPFLLVFGGEIESIDHRWNQHGLGGDNLVKSCRDLHEGKVSLLHWSGKGKPWERLDSGQPCPVDYLWEPYDLYNYKHTQIY